MPVEIYGNAEKLNGILRTLKFVSTDNYEEYGFIYIKIIDNSYDKNVADFSQNDRTEYIIRVFISPINHPPEIFFVNTESGIFYGNLDMYDNVDGEGDYLNARSLHQNNGSRSKINESNSKNNFKKTDNGDVGMSKNSNNDNGDDSDITSNYDDTNTTPRSSVDVMQIKQNQQFQIGENIQITDVDIAQKNGNKLTYLVSLSTKYGKLKIQNTDYVDFFPDMSTAKILNGKKDHFEFEDFNNGNSKSVVFSGNFFNVQNALKSAGYTPILNWIGVDIIEISIIDLGNSSPILLRYLTPYYYVI